MTAPSSTSRKRPSAHEALSKMVEWCDRNDWGSVPAKLEALCRNALLSETGTLVNEWHDCRQCNRKILVGRHRE